jgi:hypothetical protein
MIGMIVEKKDPKMMAQMFLEKVGMMDMSKLEPEKADALKKVIADVKANMDKPDMLMPLLMKGKELMAPKVEVSVEIEKEEPETEDEAPEMEDKKEYKAIDAINEIKAILGKVKEVE